MVGFTRSLVPTPPSVPANLQATPRDGEQVILNWGESEDAESYNLYWSLNPGVTKLNGTKIIDLINPCIHTGRTNGVPYYYVVTAVNIYGDESSESNEDSAIPQVPVSLPLIPQNFNAQSSAKANILNWDAVPGATSYDIYWSTTSGVTKANGEKIAGIGSLLYTHYGLTNGTAYYYIIVTLNSLGESVASTQISATPVPITYKANGTYTWNAVTGTITWNMTSNNFPTGEGPGDISIINEVVITSTTMRWFEGDEDEMTWTRQNGTPNDIVGTWIYAEDGNTHTFIFNNNGTTTLNANVTSYENDTDGKFNAESRITSNSYYITFKYRDPKKTADSVSVMGVMNNGITDTRPLEYNTSWNNSWILWSVFISNTYPTELPYVYTFFINKDNITRLVHLQALNDG